MDLLKIAIKAALEAGDVIMKIYNSKDFEIEIKDDNSPLTIADKKSHEVISKHLSATGIPILSEEGKEIPYKTRLNWKQLWIVDPVDGTKEFIKRNGEFTVNIALIEDQIPKIGVIYVPVIQTLYYSDSKNSYKIEGINSSNIKEYINKSVKLPIINNQKIESKKYFVVASKSHLSSETKSYIDNLKKENGEIEIISKGSSLKLCMVAEGLADCYPRFAPTMEWDTAAGNAICNSSGVNVIGVNSNENLIYNKENLLNEWFIIKRDDFA